jgi:hypothetical protein
MVHGLEQTYGDQIDFEYLNVDLPSTAAAKEEFGYRYQPHFFLVDANGEVVQEWVGNVNQMELERAFAGVID